MPAVSQAMYVIVLCYAAISAGLVAGYIAFVGGAYLIGQDPVVIALSIILKNRSTQEDRPKSPDLASRLAMSADPLSAARDATRRAPPTPAEDARS